MAKPRRLSLLVTLALFITTAAIVGHFVADAVCVARDAAGGSECTTGNVTDGRPDATSPVTADLHANFNLPPVPPALSLIPLIFILAAGTLAHLLYSPSPFPPPPKLLS